MPLLFESIVFALVVAPFVFIALAVSKSRNYTFAVLFLCLLAFDDFITTVPAVYSLVSIEGMDWNWAGKIFSILWALLFIRMSSLSYREVGLTFQQKNNSIRPAGIMAFILIALSVIIGIIFSSESPFNIEAIAYQLTMPGIAEELAYRGVFLALLHKAIPAQRGKLTFWYPAIITSIAFGLWHGLYLDAWNVNFELMAFLFPFIGGLAFAWLREITGSLVFPIVMHNVSNAVIVLIAML